MRNDWFYHLVAFLVVAVWGTTFISTKLLIVHGLSPAQIFTIRFIIAYVLLLMFDHKRFRSDTWRDELLFVALGISGGSLYFLAENAALSYTNATNVSIIVCSCPLFAAIMLGIFYKSERLNTAACVGSLMALAGMAIVVLNGHFVLHLSPQGDALAFIACLCWAVYSLLMKPVGNRYTSFYITRKVFFYGLITIGIYFVLRPSELHLPVEVLREPVAWGNLLYLGCIASMLCYLVWTWVMKKLGAVRATNWVYFNPITTMISAWIVLDERITPFFLIGAMLILLGLYVASKR